MGETQKNTLNRSLTASNVPVIYILTLYLFLQLLSALEVYTTCTVGSCNIDLLMLLGQTLP